jgi:hypothetical protein
VELNQNVFEHVRTRLSVFKIVVYKTVPFFLFKIVHYMNDSQPNRNNLIVQNCSVQNSTIFLFKIVQYMNVFETSVYMLYLWKKRDWDVQKMITCFGNKS